MALGYMAEAEANRKLPSARAKRRMAEGGETRRYNQRLAGMTLKQRSRHERIRQAQLYNLRVNVMGRMMMNWYLWEERGEPERGEQLLPEIAKMLKTFTSDVAERIRGAAQEAAEQVILNEQNERIMAEYTPIEKREGPKAAPVPFTQEELDAFEAAGE